MFILVSLVPSRNLMNVHDFNLVGYHESMVVTTLTHL